MFRDIPQNRRGYFSIGIYSVKNEANLGGLWRSAFALGADFIYTIGARYKPTRFDTCKSPRHIPLFEYEDWFHFKKSIPRNAKLVGIECGAKPIRNFVHPQRAIYLL